MIPLWYEDSKIRAEWRGVETEWMDVDVGVRQGCVLSGLLFIVYVNDLLEELEQDGNVDEEVKELVIVALMYADDLEVIAGNEEDLERRLKIVYEWAKKWRMKVNEKKSEVVVFGCKEIVKSKGWKMGGTRIKDGVEATCFG